VNRLLSALALVAAIVPSLRAADNLSGAWTAGIGPGTQTFVFKAQPDNRFFGVVCGPCDEPASVFRIDDGRIISDDRATFVINYDVGGPSFTKSGPYREQVTATRSGDAWTVHWQQGGGRSMTLKRVVAGYEGLTTPRPAMTSPAPESRPSPLEGKWVAAGRNAQQNFILKIRDNTVWGLICGPCQPEGVFLIDDGTVNGDNVTFYINHFDTPPSARKAGLTRNHMRGTRVGNVMKFTWVREGAEDQPGGEMTLIGPIR
jgi:hypothetical protein